MVAKRFAAVFFLTFLLTLTPALKIVFYNPDDSLGIVDLAIVSLSIAAIVAIAALAILWLRQFGLFAIYILLGLLTAAMVNTFIVPTEAATLDGMADVVEISIPKIGITLVAVVGFVAAWFFRDRTASIVKAVSVGVTAYAIIFTGAAVWKTDIGSSALLSDSRTSILSLSPERNILIISFDQMQGSVAAGAIRRDPDVAAKFDGFTVYTDAASVYPNTNYSIASVLIGHMPKRKAENLDHAILSENIVREGLRKSYAAGFTMADKTCDICLPKYPPSFGKESALNKTVQLFTLAAQQAFGIGNAAAIVIGNFAREPLAPTAVKYSWKLDIGAFLDTVDNLKVNARQPVLQYRHYYATHQPIMYRRNCKIGDETFITENQTADGARREVTCVLRSFGRLLDKLKEEGIYDHTMIILASDHGNELNINSDQTKAHADLLFPGSGILGKDNIKPAGSYNPTLFFKDFGARGQVKEVSDHASLLDVPATVCEAIGGCNLLLEGQSLRSEIPRGRVRSYWRYFGGQEHRYSDGGDRLHDGLDKWWEIRSFSGSLASGLVPSLQQPAGHAD